MIFIWGDKRFGKVDQVPGVCCVETVFFHAFFIPIFPYRSYIVGDQRSLEVQEAIERGVLRKAAYGDFMAKRIPMSTRSVLCGYGRAFLGIVIAFCVYWLAFSIAIFGFANKVHGPFSSMSLTMFGFLVAAGLLFWLSRWITQASPTRAEELRAELRVERATDGRDDFPAKKQKPRQSTNPWDNSGGNEFQ